MHETLVESLFFCLGSFSTCGKIKESQFDKWHEIDTTLGNQQKGCRELPYVCSFTLFFKGQRQDGHETSFLLGQMVN